METILITNGFIVEGFAPSLTPSTVSFEGGTCENEWFEPFSFDLEEGLTYEVYLTEDGVQVEAFEEGMERYYTGEAKLYHVLAIIKDGTGKLYVSREGQ